MDNASILSTVDSLCEQFEDALQRGERPSIQETLSECPSSHRSLLFKYLLELEADYQQQQGIVPNAAVYLREFPHYDTIIHSVFKDYAALDETTAERFSPTRHIPPYVGRQIGDYEILEEIGRGGMGIVWKAKQKSLSRVVAVKIVISSDFASEESRVRFLAEANIAGTLDHPGIIPVYEAAEEDGQLYYSMAYLEGGNLSEYIRESELAPNAAATLTREIALAVAYAHSSGVIHRDLKPANILLDGKGNPKVADFGLSRRINDTSELTATGQILGTPAYMPPEQAAGKQSEISVRSDVYSLGAILYCLLCGRPPFENSGTFDTLHRVIHEEPLPPSRISPGVPRDLETICVKCLQKSPEQRYASASALAEDLDRFLHGRPVAARPLGRVAKLTRWCRQNPVPASLLATVILVLITATSVTSYFYLLSTRRLKLLAEANTAAELAVVQHRQSAARAETESQISMATLEHILYDVQAELERQPNLQETRRKVLNTVGEHLERARRLHEEDRRLSRHEATMVLNLAEVYRQVGDTNGNIGITATRALYTEAIRDLEELLQANPRDPARILDVIKARYLFGSQLLDSDAWVEAQTVLLATIDLCQQLETLTPDDPEPTYWLARSEEGWATAGLRTGDIAAAREYCQRSLTRSRKLAEKWPADLRFVRHCAESCERMGDIYVKKLDDFEPAQELYDEYLMWVEKLVAADPTDAGYQMDLSSVYERLGMLHMRRKDYPAAQRAYEESLRICLPLGEAAPDNYQTKWDVAWSWHHVGTVTLVLGDLARARTAWQKTIDLRRPLVEYDPQNAQRVNGLHQAFVGLATVCERASEFEEAKAIYEKSLQFLTAYHQTTGATHFQSAEDAVRRKIADCDTALRANAPHDKAAGQTLLNNRRSSAASASAAYPVSITSRASATKHALAALSIGPSAGSPIPRACPRPS